jgi:hypothetical protein
MTLKQDRLVKEIMNPENKTMKECGIKAGYETVTSRQIYKKDTKRYIVGVLERQGITKESLGRAYQELIELCKRKGDTATIKGALDSLAKLNKLLQDSNTQQVTAIFNDTLIQKLRDSIPLEQTQEPK